MSGRPDPQDPEDPLRRPEAGELIDRVTGRWRGVTAVALLAGAAGALGGRSGLVLAGVLGVVFAAHARAAAPPALDIELDRTLDRREAAPGEEVRVTVTVRNAGDRLLPDLRVVDGVPSGLSVADGSPRFATSLRPGRKATLSYTVAATRGEHAFEPVTVLARGFSGAIERETRLDGPETALTCVPPLATGGAFPLRMQTTPYTGRVTTDAGGSGVEFHAVREYRPGDPLSRIDWHRRARTGELATLEFRQERAATVVLVVDAREEAYLSPGEGRTRDGNGNANGNAGRNGDAAGNADSTVERSVRAAGEAFTGLLAAGDRVGIAGFGPGECWLPPGAGETHRARARELLATNPVLAPSPPDDSFFPSVNLRHLRRRLPADAQVVLFSPLADDYVVTVARRLDAYGHPVTVASPDPTADRTTGQRLARVERDLRLSKLRGAGLRVVDWGDEPFAAALDRARRRWSHG